MPEKANSYQTMKPRRPPYMVPEQIFPGFSNLTRLIMSTVLATLFFSRDAKAGPIEDIRLFTAGEKLAFDSTGHEKAKGVSVKIFYPKTWKAKEGARPNIIQSFVSDDKLSTIMLQAMVLPPEINRKLTAEEKAILVEEDTLKDAFISSNDKFISYKLTKIDGEPCGMIESTSVGDRAGHKLLTRQIVFVVPVDGCLLSITAMTGVEALEGKDALETRFKAIKPLFELIVSSCIFPRKWEKR